MNAVPLVLLCLLSAPLPVARPNVVEGPPFQIGAILDWEWQFGGEQSPPTKWITRFNRDGTYEGYMGVVAYKGNWSWDPRKRILRVYESMVPGLPMMSVPPPSLHILYLNREGRGYTESGSVVRLKKPVFIDLKTLKP